MKKIYSKYDNIGNLVEALKEVQVGSKLKFWHEKKRYTCTGRSENFIIISKPFNLKEDCCMYSILDLTQMRCNRDNLVFGIYNYSNPEDCKDALEALERSLVPWEERFIKCEPDEDGRVKLIPKYPEADFTLEISYRGGANIVDAIEEVYI